MKKTTLALLLVATFSTGSNAVIPTDVQWVRIIGGRAGQPHFKCGEVTNFGSIIRYVPSDACRQKFGVHYEWAHVFGKSSMRCAEVTPQGEVIELVNDDFCRN